MRSHPADAPGVHDAARARHPHTPRPDAARSGDASPDDAVVARNLHKRFGSVHAVRGIDLAIERGCVYGLIGANGAGKTTTMRMLVDAIRPSEGTLRVLGEEPRRASPALRRRIGYLPGEVSFTERTSGRALLEHYARLSGPVAPGAIDALAERFDLDLTRPVRTLSKGNRQKLGIIQAFMHDPELLILDEPTSGLDPLMQREFAGLVREARDRGRTIVLSSHVLGEIQHTADRAAVISHGQILAEGDLASLRLTGVSALRCVVQAPASHLEAALLGAGVADVVVRESAGAAVATGTAHGIDAVVKALAAFPVLDLTVEEPDLEQSILTLYESPQP